MHSKAAIKVINIGGQEIVLNTLHDIYKTKKTTKERSNFEKDIGKKLVAEFKKEVKDLTKKLLALNSFNTAKYDKYYLVLIEAIDAYILKNYQATIACCGIAAEIIALDLIINKRPQIIKKDNFDHMSQNSRLILLFMTSNIRQGTYLKLDEIRKIRNKYIHQTSSISNHDKDAKKCLDNLIDSIKIIYKPV